MPDDPNHKNEHPSSGRITREWTILDIISRHRETEGVFKNLEAETGRCICCEGLFLSLKDATREFGFDVEPAQERIEQSIAGDEKQ